jgi:hypothetical protein
MYIFRTIQAKQLIVKLLVPWCLFVGNQQQLTDTSTSFGYFLEPQRHESSQYSAFSYPQFCANPMEPTLRYFFFWKSKIPQWPLRIWHWSKPTVKEWRSLLVMPMSGEYHIFY